MSTDALYVAMTGAKQSMIAQAVNSNNLANVNTPGFRADQYNAFSMALFGETLPSTVYSVPEEVTSDLTPGSIMTTDRDLDIAVQGEGWIAVQAPNGQEAYTRSGSLQINSAGQLQTSTGLMVLGSGGPISIPPSESMTIAKDGTINIRPLGQQANALAQIGQIKLVNPDKASLTKGDDGLFRVEGGAPAPVDTNVKIVSKALESSNVNAIESMVNLISLSRQFEMQVKIIKQNDQAGDALAQLLQI